MPTNPQLSVDECARERQELAEMLLSNMQELITKAEARLNLDYVDLDSSKGKQLCVPLILAAFDNIVRRVLPQYNVKCPWCGGDVSDDTSVLPSAPKEAGSG